MGATASAIEKAAREYPDLRPYLPFGSSLPDVRTLEQFVDELARAESAAQNAYRKLLGMRRLGLDKRSDYTVYAELQNAIYKAQTSAIQLVLAVVRAAAPGSDFLLAPLLTPPTPLPLLVWGTAHESQPAGTAGLGSIQVAAIVAAALAALGLLYLYSDEIANMVDDLTTVYVAHARANQHTELLEARRTTFEACRTRGGDEVTCRESSVALNPEGPDVGEGRGDGSSGMATLGWLAVGGVVLVAVVVGLSAAIKASGPRRAFRGYGQVSTSPVGRLPRAAPDLDGSRSRYNLEVGR